MQCGSVVDLEPHALVQIYFPDVYDIKYLMKFCSNLHGGLNKLAETLEVERVGPQHQVSPACLLQRTSIWAGLCCPGLAPALEHAHASFWPGRLVCMTGLTSVAACAGGLGQPADCLYLLAAKGHLLRRA